MYLWEPTPEVHEIDYSIRQFHEGLIKILYYHDALLMDSMQRAFEAYTWLDSGWSKGCFTLIRMAWDPSIEGFLNDMIMHGERMTQCHIWDSGIVCSDHWGHQIVEALV